MHTLEESSPPSNCRAIFKVKIRKNFIDPADDATMAPDGASSLHTHPNTRPPARLCGAMPLRPTIVDVGRYTSLHHRTNSNHASAPKMMPSRRVMTLDGRHHPIRESQI
jgi:hypothetical protein